MLIPVIIRGLGLSQNNPRILRYADVILLKAEAIVRSGGSLADAIALVNEIRARARASGDGATVPADLATPGTGAEALDLIFRERRLELAFEEGHRWYDLRRRHLLVKWTLQPLILTVRTDFAFEEFKITTFRFLNCGWSKSTNLIKMKDTIKQNKFLKGMSFPAGLFFFLEATHSH